MSGNKIDGWIMCDSFGIEDCVVAVLVDSVESYCGAVGVLATTVTMKSGKQHILACHFEDFGVWLE